MKPTDDLLRIASVGGGIDMRHHNRPTEDLVRIARSLGLTEDCFSLTARSPLTILYVSRRSAKGESSSASNRDGPDNR
jgi:hypothetical protein